MPDSLLVGSRVVCAVTRVLADRQPPYAVARVEGRNVLLPGRHWPGGAVLKQGDLVSFVVRADRQPGKYYATSLEVVSAARDAQESR